jgi:hypothetical protein
VALAIEIATKFGNPTAPQPLSSSERMTLIPEVQKEGTIMNQDRDKNMQNQQGKQQGQNQPQSNERGNPSTTERVQPEPNRGGGQKPEGEKPTGGNQPKF